MAATFSAKAAEQLEKIISYIARQSPQNARRVAKRVDRAAQMLDDNPHLAPERRDLTDGPPYVRHGRSHRSFSSTGNAVAVARKSSLSPTGVS